ncbi:NAD-dependent epimerase/dehydratase family protein [Maribacter sp. MJ134]|uniref:NmrA family NAD(P)-binding protein n=1 Tax=Maribacter sp. MJ134 TaxID=2496865 RepID=UPI000F8231B4|nr:NmrA family NAD(P)-binding protein [Maribacter sp. MJ134]AZQ59338.1 NAD-dependent epimerase/dehydratase family protein [Maribacter sp. MJ134]
MKTENIVVIGGTGKTGSRVVKNLQEAGYNVRVVGHKTNPALHWENPKTYDAVLEGMDRAYIVYYPDLAVPGSREAITTLTKKAIAAGLKKVVLLSGKGETEAEACEQIVANSGLDYTLVRASWFNQNFSEGAFIDFVLDGVVALPMPEARIPFVDANDIADVVSKVLVDDSYNGQTITVTGPKMRTFEEVVGIMANASNRELQYVPISIEEFKDGMRKAGLPDSYVWLFGYLFKEVLGNPDNQEISNDVEKVLGRKAIDFTEYAEQVAATGAWNPVTTA